MTEIVFGIDQRTHAQIDHDCPRGLEPHGDSRPGYHANGEGVLLFATYLNARCGCRVTGNGTLQHPLTIAACNKHREEMFG